MINHLTFDTLPAGEGGTYAVWRYDNSRQPASLHDHDFHELFWIEAGEGCHWINGECRPLTTGLLVLIRAEDVHSFSAARAGTAVRFVNVAFRRTLWDALWRGGLRRAPGLWAERDHRAREYRLDPGQLERLRGLAHDLAAGARDAFSFSAFIAGVASLLRNAAAQQPPPGLPGWLAEACTRVRAPHQLSGGIRAFARLAGCTPEHLARSVRRHLSQTPTDLLNAARLSHAAQQLCTTDRPIIDVAGDCGFGNLGHFYKLFRQRYGTSPQRYRRHARPPVTTLQRG
ncbi:MAG: AraC family transcriptional regulator [Opitutae bacterium]|nr:AraC family transcriptional regulator [Opitutae bacterium]